MTKFHFIEKRCFYLFRLCSLFLAVLICLGAANFPLYAAGSIAEEANSNIEMQNQTSADTSAADTSAAETSASASESSGGTSESTGSSDIPVLDITSQSSIIVGTGRGMTLYQSQKDIAANYPAASKLMTAVIALESLTLDTQVTISSGAEALDNKSKTPLYLSKGEKCSVKYLVTALIYMDSDAAAFSLAEYIASDEQSFVKKMNETAKALNMSSTRFANTSGDADVTAFPTSPNTVDYSSYANQYTTVSDLSSLFRYALNIKEFRDLFTKYKTLLFLSDGSPKTLTNAMSAAWGLNPQLSGAARFESDDSGSVSCILALASVDDFEIAVILADSQNDYIYQDLYKSINYTFSAYEVSDLVVAGDTYTKVSIAGISEPLTAVFGKTVRYIHPVGNDYIKPNAVFIPDETVTLPITMGQSLGQVRFELEDGTQIDTDVIAAESMWTKSDFLSDTIALLKANSNLTVIIGIAAALFLVSVIISLCSTLTKFFRSGKHQNKTFPH